MERYRGAWRLEFSALYLLCCALSLSLIKFDCGLVHRLQPVRFWFGLNFVQKHTGLKPALLVAELNASI